MIGLWWVLAVWAGPEVTREAQVLREDMVRHTQRTTWAGVDEAYEQLVALGVPLTFEDHRLGYEAAVQLGLAAEAVLRARLAVALQPDLELSAALDRYDKQYAPVRIVGSWRQRPRFVRARMPFVPDQRAAVDYARQRVEETGSFSGLLPTGNYLIGDRELTVEAGLGEVVIDVRRPGGFGALPMPDAEQRGGGFLDREPPVLYAGVAAMVGPSFGFAAAASNGLGPEALSGAGARMALSAEIGFSPSLALAPGASWMGTYGVNDGADQLGVDLDLVIRRGPLRLALGPAWSVTWQRGYGVVGGPDRQQDGDGRPDAALPYRGRSWGPGAGLDVGLRVGELRGIDLLVGLSAQWQSGPHNLVSGALGIGIAPQVPDVGRR